MAEVKFIDSLTRQNERGDYRPDHALLKRRVDVATLWSGRRFHPIIERKNFAADA